MKIGLFDADLVDGGTRHPNLTLMKLSGYFNNIGVDNELMLGGGDLFDGQYDKIYVSRVFSKTKLPNFAIDGDVLIGGTGGYVDNPSLSEADFKKLRTIDMRFLENHLYGYNERCQMPNYHLYDDYASLQSNKNRVRDYADFSIGFMTRGCIRHCPFCVNRYENEVKRYSHLCNFLDENRKYIYLWDDNVMASPMELFNEVFDELIKSGKPFQFKQGLDLRLMTDYKAEILTNCKYYGDYIFAFDQWKDRCWIEKKLQLWRKYTDKQTKLYLFCGFRQNGDKEAFYEDIITIFKRIEILMRYHCLGYVMRHADYMNSYMPNMYVQIARWCNQPQFYKKKSFFEFITEEHESHSMPVKTLLRFAYEFKDKKNEFEYYFNLKFEDI